MCQPLCDIYIMSLSWHQHLYYNNQLYKDGVPVAFSKSQSKQIFKWAIGDSDLKHETRSFFLYNGSHNIVFPQLDSVPSNSVFYFYEPLTYYNNNRIGHQDHILRTDNCKGVRSFELDNVEQFVKKHNIVDHVVYLPDQNAASYLKTQYNLTFDWYDPYLASEAARLNTFGKYLPHCYYTNKISNKLWCGSWRYDPVRHYIIGDLVKRNVHKENSISWFYYVPRDDITNTLWFNADAQLINTLERLNVVGPLNIDTDATELVHYKNSYPTVPQTTKDPAAHIQQGFCALVIETRVVQPWVNLSEKTLHAIKNRRPFLLYGAPGSLQVLRDAGIKTFGNYWDESYDNITDSVERIQAVNDIAEELNNKSLTELKQMYTDMKSILMHNLRQVKKIHSKAKY